RGAAHLRSAHASKTGWADATVPRVPGRQRVGGLSVPALIVALLLASVRAGEAFTCADADGAGCPLPGSTCFAGCNEADVRDVVAKVNGCPGGEVTIAMGPDLATPCGVAPIPLAMAPTS